MKRVKDINRMNYPNFTNANLPRFWVNPETGQIEVVNPSAPAIPSEPNPAWTPVPEGVPVGRSFKNDLWYDISIVNGETVETLMDPQPPHLLDL